MRMMAMTTTAAFLALLLVSGCTATQKGAVMGAAGGGALGAVAGNNIPGMSTTSGALAGAAVGGLLGGVMGHQQDQITAQRQQVGALSEQVNSSIVNVTNSNGSVTPVVLRRVGNQWQGPRGEYYANLPSPEQLRGAYGF